MNGIMKMHDMQIKKGLITVKKWYNYLYILIKIQS